MKLIVFGASGRCGSWVVRLARARAYEDVTAVVRPESNYLPPSGVAVERGEVTDPEFVRSTLTGHRVIISCLGLRRAGLSPWARLLSQPDLVERALENVIKGVSTAGGARLLWISAGGVGSSRTQASCDLTP